MCRTSGITSLLSIQRAEEGLNCRAKFRIGNERYVVVTGISQFYELFGSSTRRSRGCRCEQPSTQFNRHDGIPRSVKLQNGTCHLWDAVDRIKAIDERQPDRQQRVMILTRVNQRRKRRRAPRTPDRIPGHRRIGFASRLGRYSPMIFAILAARKCVGLFVADDLLRGRVKSHGSTGS